MKDKTKEISEYIKAFPIKPGELVILCVDKDSGLRPDEIARINEPALVNTIFFMRNATRTQMLRSFGKALGDLDLDDEKKKQVIESFLKYLDEDFENRT